MISRFCQAALCATTVIAAVPAQAQQSAPASEIPARSAAEAAQKQAYLPLFQFTVGEKLAYRLTTDLDGTLATPSGTVPVKLHQEMVLDLTVQDVDARKVATFAESVESVSRTVNGASQPVSAAELKQYQSGLPPLLMRPDGQTVLASGAAAQPDAFDVNSPLASLQLFRSALLPPAAVPIGGAWRSVVSFASQTYYQRSQLDSAVSDPGGHQILTIDLKLSGKSEPGGLRLPTGARLYVYAGGAGVNQFDNTSGTLLDSQVTTHAKATVQTPGQAPARSTLTTTFRIQLAR